MNNYELDKWIPIENTHFTGDRVGIKEVMFKVFSENCKDGVCTASICFRKDDGSVTGFYHPPENLEFEIDQKYLFKTEVVDE